MLKKFYQVLQYTPSPFLLAVLLTTSVFIFCLFAFDHGPLELLNFWGSSFSSLHQFSMQMLLILVLGYVLAQSAPFQFVLRLCLKRIQTEGQAIVMGTILSCLFSYFNWGVGLVASALLAQQLKHKFPNLSYAHIVATCFSGFLVWHGGLSGSIPLQLATMSGEMFYPVQKTLFSHYNLVILALHFIGLPIVNYVFYRTHRDANLVEKISFHEQSNKKELSSALVAIVLSVIGLFYFVMALYDQGTLDLNLFIVFLLFAGILLHKGLKQYEKAFEQSIFVGAGIVLLFPFYAAMMGLISQSGFGKLVTEFFTQFANAQNLPVISYLSAGFLNIFVPSGGAQWAIQAPIFIPLAQKLNVDVSRVAMMIAWGDAWTNMLQPFFALPLLSIAKIELKQIMPQCFWLFIASGTITMISIYMLF